MLHGRSGFACQHGGTKCILNEIFHRKKNDFPSKCTTFFAVQLCMCVFIIYKRHKTPAKSNYVVNVCIEIARGWHLVINIYFMSVCYSPNPVFSWTHSFPWDCCLGIRKWGDCLLLGWDDIAIETRIINASCTHGKEEKVEIPQRS